MDPMNGLETFVASVFSNFASIPSWALYACTLISGYATVRYLAKANETEKIKARFWFAVAGIGVSFYPIIPALSLLFSPRRSEIVSILEDAGWAFFGGVVLAILWYRWITPRLLVARESALTRSPFDSDPIDVRHIADYYPKTRRVVDPRRHFMKGKIYVGSGEKGPLYFERAEPGKTFPHTLVAGTTGAGKGVALAVLAAQFLADGEAVFFIDPKNDEWAPHVLYAECLRLSVPYHYVDLRSTAGPQFNLIAGCTSSELEELLEAGLDIQRRGDTADVYRGEERRWLVMLAEATKAGDTLADLWNRHGDEIYRSAKDFANKIRELARIPSINAKTGEDFLARVVQGGGCVYVVGSSKSDAIRVIQRAMLVRLFQLAENRDRIEGTPRHIFTVLDEFASSMSLPALNGLQQMRDKGMHLAIAMQSFSDVRGPGMNADPVYVAGVVDEATPLKITYRLQSAELAELLAVKSGEHPIYRQMVEEHITPGLSRAVEPHRKMTQDVRPLFPSVLLQNLPPSCAVVFGVGDTAQFTWVARIPVEKNRDSVRIHELPGVKAASDSLLTESPITLTPPQSPSLATGSESPI
jgi:hypothetical protein